jgi:antitoxin component YwqK of YwqJK toxin-antitoxin module
MMKKLLFLTICAFILLNACQPDRPFVEVYNDGTLYESFQINSDSLKHGSYNRYFKDGNVAEEAQYENGKLNGKRIIYYHTGVIEIEEIYDMDSLEGVLNSYYPSGKKEFTCEYIKNKIQGKAIKYYESGQVMEEVLFKDNEENGPFVEYYDNGQIEWKGTYLNGDNEFGLLEQFNKSGEVIKKMECDSLGICVTVWKKDAEIN